MTGQATHKCPSCGGRHTELREKRESNGIMGPGYASWRTDSWWSCLDCGVRFDPVGEPERGRTVSVRHGTPEYAEMLKARFPDGSARSASSTFEFRGHRWRYEHTSFDDEGDFTVLWRPDEPAPPDIAVDPGSVVLGGEPDRHELADSLAEAAGLPRVMNTHAKAGTRVTPVYRDGRVFGGYPAQAATAERYLKEGEVYTVESTDVGSWNTTVYLKEVPGVGFNSVCLAEVDG